MLGTCSHLGGPLELLHTALFPLPDATAEAVTVVGAEVQLPPGSDVQGHGLKLHTCLHSFPISCPGALEPQCCWEFPLLLPLKNLNFTEHKHKF